MAKQHPLFDDYWASKNADLSKITVPAFVVASWSDHGLHTPWDTRRFQEDRFQGQVAYGSRAKEVVAFLPKENRGETETVLQ